MTTLTVRDVPEDQVAVIKRRAEREGRSMEAYLRRFIERETKRMTPSEWAESLRNDPPVSSCVTSKDVQKAVREAREELERRAQDIVNRVRPGMEENE